MIMLNDSTASAVDDAKMARRSLIEPSFILIGYIFTDLGSIFATAAFRLDCKAIIKDLLFI